MVNRGGGAEFRGDPFCIEIACGGPPVARHVALGEKMRDPLKETKWLPRTGFGEFTPPTCFFFILNGLAAIESSAGSSAVQTEADSLGSRWCVHWSSKSPPGWGKGSRTAKRPPRWLRLCPGTGAAVAPDEGRREGTKGQLGV